MSHEYLFGVCTDILHDNGAVNRHEESPRFIFLGLAPPELARVESVLSQMTDEERSVFAVGEDSVARLLAAQFGVGTLHEGLNRWFEGGMRRL